jgi:formylglycine-generating enzyme required for sulfatase activity
MIGLLLVSACNGKQRVSDIEPCLGEVPPAINLPAATIIIGSETGYPEEVIRQVALNEFNIDATEVTNAQFREFVTETGYLTTAELPHSDGLKPGAAVFKSPTRENPSWWHFVEGANWRHPEGPDTNITGKDNEPVVQVSLIDAKAYAEWVGRALPTEGQWEYAARASSQTKYVWGEERAPDGKEQANTWQGAFPIQNSEKDGYRLRAPIGCFTPNDFGLYDMIGNVWEWTTTEYEQTRIPNSFTIKGGSYLCAENFCARYRASARQAQEMDFSTNHIGFRTVNRSTGS